jgi:hypothetical protein
MGSLSVVLSGVSFGISREFELTEQSLPSGARRQTGAATMNDTERSPSQSAVQARQREMAVEHILFHVVKHVEAQHPGLIDTIERSLDHLGDPGKDGTGDDEAVREIARKLLASARKD